MKKKIIISIIATFLLIVISIPIIYFFNNNKNITDFSEYVMTKKLESTDLKFSSGKKYVFGLNKNYNCQIAESEFLGYTGNMIFVREENEIKTNNFNTVLCSSNESIENIQKLTDEFINKSLEYIGKSDEIIPTMLVINSTIKEVDKYTDIINKRVVYRTYVYTKNDTFIIDVYSENKNIIGEFSYIFEVEEIEPEDAAG